MLNARTNLRLTPAFHKYLKRIREQYGLSFSNLIRLALGIALSQLDPDFSPDRFPDFDEIPYHVLNQGNK